MQRKKALQNTGNMSGKKFWNSSIIGRILKNPIHIGNTVFQKRKWLRSVLNGQYVCRRTNGNPVKIRMMGSFQKTV